MSKCWRTTYSASAEHGVWWFRILGYGLTLYAPWKQALFTEREGIRKFIRVKGWRIGVLRP